MEKEKELKEKIEEMRERICDNLPKRVHDNLKLEK